MSREYKNGVWITTRDSKTPDSERHVERDDPLFPSFQFLFTGQEIELDLEAIAEKHGLTPEEVFLNLHENYGYACLGTGENPAKGEKLTDEEKEIRKQAMKNALVALKIPHILIKGKYMGVEEDTYLIPFNYRTIGLAAVLQGELIKQLIKIATDNNQDSILIEIGGRACYVMTSGPDEGCVSVGNSAIVYPNSDGQVPLPVDCFSLFIRKNGSGVIGFTCAINFTKTYKNIQQFADEENGILQENYKDFITAPVVPSASGETKRKKIFMTRGTNGYNDYALETKAKLEKAGLKVAVFGTDANIAKINEELADENSELFKRAKLYKEKLAAENAELVKDGKEPKKENIWGDIIRPEFIKRNIEIYQSLLKSDYGVIIYCDMNKFAVADFMKPYIEPALQLGHDIVSLVMNSFAFDPARTDFVEILCNLYGKMMVRHVGDFKSEAGQINAESITVDGMVVKQYHDLTTTEVLALVSTPEQASVAALNSGLVGTLLGSTQPQQQSKQDSSVESKIVSTPTGTL